MSPATGCIQLCNLFDHRSRLDHILVSSGIRAVRSGMSTAIAVEFVEYHICAADMVCVRMCQHQHSQVQRFQDIPDRTEPLFLGHCHRHQSAWRDRPVSEGYSHPDRCLQNERSDHLHLQTDRSVRPDRRPVQRLRCSATDGSDPIISKGITGSTEKQNCDGTQ